MDRQEITEFDGDAVPVIAGVTQDENGDTVVTFGLQPYAATRCPRFANPADQRQWDAIWRTRLEVLEAVFPWIREELSRLSGGNPKSIVEVRRDWLLGSGSGRAETTALLERANREWELLTGLKPLDSPGAWIGAGVAAGFAAVSVEETRFNRLAAAITAWAKARLATVELSSDNAAENTPAATAIELLAIATPDAPDVLRIAQDKSTSVNERLLMLAAHDRRFEGETSDRLAALLGCSAGLIRQQPAWKAWQAEKADAS